MLRVLSHRADEPHAVLAFERKGSEDVGFVQGHMQLMIHQRTGRLRVGDIEEMLIRSAGKARAQRFAHRGMRTVAAG